MMSLLFIILISILLFQATSFKISHKISPLTKNSSLFRLNEVKFKMMSDNVVGSTEIPQNVIMVSFLHRLYLVD